MGILAILRLAIPWNIRVLLVQFFFPSPWCAFEMHEPYNGVFGNNCGVRTDCVPVRYSSGVDSYAVSLKRGAGPSSGALVDLSNLASGGFSGARLVLAAPKRSIGRRL